jgi:hypothetical protein
MDFTYVVQTLIKSDVFEGLLRNLPFTSSMSQPVPTDTLILHLFKEIVGIKGFIVKFSFSETESDLNVEFMIAP